MSIYGKLLDDTENVFRPAKRTSTVRHFDGWDFSKRNSADVRRDLFGSVEPRYGHPPVEGKPTKRLPEITDWRRAEEDDKIAIGKLQALTGDIANLLYKRKSVDELIKTSYIAIVQFDSEGNLISFTAYDCYPNIPAVPAFWKEWLTVHYRLEGIDARNVLFIHYMVWQPEQADRFLPVLLKILFSEFLYLKYIIVIKPPKAVVPKFYAEYFIPVLPPGMEEFEYSSIQLLLLCLRSSVVHPLPIRNVFGQDLDVVMSILKKRLKKDDGSWDLVNFVYQKNKKTLICEKGGHMAGVMVLNLTIDLELLNEGFDLTPFNGLRKEDFVDDSYSFSTDTKKAFSMDLKSNISIPESRLVFPKINWESIGGLDGTEDNTEESRSTVSPLDSVSFSFYRSISQFSLLRLGSIFEVKQTDDYMKDMFPKAEDVNVVIHKSESTITHFFPPKYYGPINAFVIDFFALDCARIDEKLSSFDFLEAAFRVVPDRDYCILLIPTDFIPFPLMDLFVRVTPKLMSSLKQELYLFHKNLLSINSISVRPAKLDDIGDIGYFLKDVEDGGIVYQDIVNETVVRKKDPKIFVLTVQDTIVGVSLISPEVEKFHMYFEVSDISPDRPYEDESHSLIKHLVINPIYHNHARFFVRDIMRLVDVKCVYYTHKKTHRGHRSLLTVLGEFAPIRPKKKAALLNPHPGVPHPETGKKNLFSLFFLSPPLCGFQRIHLNIIIVVVGASRTALSFLESLIYGPASYLYKFNNLICVTPQELKADSEEESIRELMFPVRDNFSRNYISMLSLEAYVHFIYGTMTSINRSEKFIILNSKTIIRYDYLVLTCGRQFLMPKNRADQVTTKNCKVAFKSSLARYLGSNLAERGDDSKMPDPHQPSNLFIINSSRDAQVAVRNLQPLMQKMKNIRKNEKKIIVYGCHLEVFLTIHTLLKLGIPGEFIVFVEPFPAGGSVTIFNDPRLDQAVLQSVIDSKVGYYTEYILYDWSGSDDNIAAIKFNSKYKQIDIPCLAFFPFIEKLVSDVTFNACNNAGLVYDGRLVINHNFRTNDKYIYAAGTFTKYARRYFANDCSHEYYNSREVGQKLATIIRNVLDPTAKNKVEENSYLVPNLIAPVHFYCQLPGDFNLFMLRKPGKPVDLETAYNFTNYGEVLTTGDCQMKKGFGYFRLHLSPEGFVESITCYTKDKIDYVNLSALYGLHEKILNNLLQRFDMALINDFFDYFRQPWAAAIFHENFQSLRNYNYAAFFQETSDNTIFFNRVIEELKSNKWEALPDAAVQELMRRYKNSKIQEDVKNNLMEFLEHYKHDLPVYATGTLLKNSVKKRLEMSRRGQT